MLIDSEYRILTAKKKLKEKQRKTIQKTNNQIHVLITDFAQNHVRLAGTMHNSVSWV